MHLRLLPLLFVCLIASGAAGQGANVTVSGKVVDKAANGLYAFITAYGADNTIVARGYSAISGANIGTYSLSLPTGTYDFYVRAFGFAPVEDRGVSVQGNITRNFTIDPAGDRTVPSWLKSSRVAPQTVFAGTAGSTATLTLKSTSALGPSIALFNEFGNFSVDDRTVGTIDLFDDGTRGDAVAGDLTYSRSGVGFNGATDLRCGQLTNGALLYARESAPQARIVALPQAQLIGVKPAQLAIRTIDAKTQYSRSAANIVFDTSKEGFQKEAAKQFYKSFADVYDFIYMIPETSIVSAGFCDRVRNDVTGIGLPIFDNGAQYGSAGRLRSVILIDLSADPPLLHEVMHTWAVWITPPFDAGYGAHWGYAGVNGVLGGFDATKLVANGDGSWTVPDVTTNGYRSDSSQYAPLELYLAGLAPLSAVPTVPVFISPQTIGGSSTHFSGTRRDVAGADIAAKFGPRVPAFGAAPARFRIAVVGVTSQLMNAAGMAYLNTLAEQLSGVAPTCLPAISFSTATGGAGAMDPAIIPRSMPRSRAVRR